MIIGAHAIVYSNAANADRAFLRDVLGFSGIDAGDGWLIFRLPPSEVAIHPTDEHPKHELYLMCDNISQQLAELADQGIETSQPISDQGWGCSPPSPYPAGPSLASTSQHRRPSPSRYRAKKDSMAALSPAYPANDLAFPLLAS